MAVLTVIDASSSELDTLSVQAKEELVATPVHSRKPARCSMADASQCLAVVARARQLQVHRFSDGIGLPRPRTDERSVRQTYHGRRVCMVDEPVVSCSDTER